MDDQEPLPTDLRKLNRNEVNRLWEQVCLNELLRAEACEKEAAESEKTNDLYNATRSWWCAIHEVLAVYGQAQTQLGCVLEPFPGPALLRLKKMTHDLGRGIVSETITDAGKGQLGRPMGWTERRDIAHAIFYIEACKRGDIEDRSFNQTVRGKFNVTAKAVQKWVANSDLICAGIMPPDSPGAIERKMAECGKRYARIGRGAPSE